MTILTSISVACERERERNKQKTNCATITLFLWSVLLSNIALDKSASEKSLSYGKILNIPMLRWFLFRHQTDPRRLLSAGRDPESNFWWIASYRNVFASLNRFVEFREMLEERAVCFIDYNCVLNYAALMPRSVVVWTYKVTILACITLQVLLSKVHTIHITLSSSSCSSLLFVCTGIVSAFSNVVLYKARS